MTTITTYQPEHRPRLRLDGVQEVRLLDDLDTLRTEKRILQALVAVARDRRWRGSASQSTINPTNL